MPPMVIRTKIIATVGPASGEVRTLRALARAGCDVDHTILAHGLRVETTARRIFKLERARQHRIER